METMYRGGLSYSPVSGGHTGLMLGCWDHENTPTLIKDLERTVAVAERKCNNLEQQINIYKNHLKCPKLEGKIETIVISKKSKKKSNRIGPSKAVECYSKNQKNHIVKNCLDMKLYDKIKMKITEVNNDISEANRKIGLKNSNFQLVPDYRDFAYTNMFESTPSELSSHKAGRHFNKPAKSDSVINCKNLEHSDVAHITKGEFQLYKNLSKKISLKSVSFKKTPRLKNQRKTTIPVSRSKSLPKPRLKFSKSNVVTTDKKSPKKEKFKIRKIPLKGVTMQNPIALKKAGKKIDSPVGYREPLKRRKSLSPFNSSKQNKIKLNKSANVLYDSYQDPNSVECENSLAQIKRSSCSPLMMSNKFAPSEDAASRKSSTVIKVPKKPIPFTICGSTARSFNIGMNIQHVMSMMKQKKPNIKLVSNCRNKSQEILIDDSPQFGSSEAGFSYLPETRTCSKGGEESLKSMAVKKSKSGSGVDLRKNLAVKQVEMRKYRPISCQDDGKSTRSELSEIHNDLMQLHSKYTTLQTQVSRDRLEKVCADGEIRALESAIDKKELQYKTFCEEFLVLKDKLKSLKKKYMPQIRPRSQQNKPTLRKTRNTKSFSKVMR